MYNYNQHHTIQHSEIKLPLFVVFIDGVYRAQERGVERWEARDDAATVQAVAEDIVRQRRRRSPQQIRTARSFQAHRRFVCHVEERQGFEVCGRRPRRFH